MATIIFFNSSIQVSSAGFIGIIPGFNGNKSKYEYLNSIKISLNLPEYFGNNWDALEECLHDMDWEPVVDRKCYLIVWSLPTENDDIHIFKDILSDPGIGFEVIFIHESLMTKWNQA